MKQQTLSMAAAHIAQYRKTIWRKAILAAMEQIVPWSQLCSVIEPHVPKMGFAKKVAHRVVFMDQGEIVEDASKDECFGSPRSDMAQQFLSKILTH